MTTFKGAANKLDGLADDIRSDAKDAMQESTDDVSTSLRGKLSANGSVATTTLLNSIRAVNRGAAGSGYTNAQIVAAYYWKFLEYGTGVYTSRGYPSPDFAPFGPIYAWVLAKGVTPDPRGDYETQREIAWAIANDISTGTESNPFARPVWRGPFGKSHIKGQIEQSINRAIRRNI